MITQAKLQELLHYNPATGVFTWRVETRSRGGLKRVGDVAGFPMNNGYIRIGLNGKRYAAHRLAWLYVHGAWPTDEIDHKDTVRSHNWIDNLRPATRLQNSQNQRRAHASSASGLIGTSPCRNGRWKAQIRIDGKSQYLGFFKTAEDAHAAYVAAKTAAHPFQTLMQAA